MNVEPGDASFSSNLLPPASSLKPPPRSYSRAASMTQSPTVLICGYFGFGNSGDEAILSVLLADLNEVFDKPNITVLAGSIESIAADHHVDAIHWTDIGRIREQAEASDLMVLGGGGLFHDQQDFDPAAILTPAHGGMSYWAGFALLSHLVDKPLAIYGAGVGPLATEEGKRLTAMCFRAASAASVRNQGSARATGGTRDPRRSGDRRPGLQDGGPTARSAWRFWPTSTYPRPKPESWSPSGHGATMVSSPVWPNNSIDWCHPTTRSLSSSHSRCRRTGRRTTRRWRCGSSPR